jgi:hypothetical protein
MPPILTSPKTRLTRLRSISLLTRGAKVKIEVDQNGLIHRTQSDVPGRNEPAGKPGSQTCITRISTQVYVPTGALFCEVFFLGGDGTTEESARSFDPVVERLCGSAYAARKRLQLILDPESLSWPRRLHAPVTEPPHRIAYSYRKAVMGSILAPGAASGQIAAERDNDAEQRRGSATPCAASSACSAAKPG